MVALISLVPMAAFPWEQEGLDDSYLLPPPLRQARPRWVGSQPELASLLSQCRWDSGTRVFFRLDFSFVAI